MAKIKTSAETVSADYNIAQMLEQPNGLQKVALEMLPPFIREMRDYESFGRKILMVHNVSSEDLHLIDGEPFMYYPKDVNARAACYGEDAETPRYQVEGDGVNVGVVTIMSDNHTINLKRLMVQKYQYLERTRELCAQAMSKAEDLRILEITEGLLKGTGSVTAPEFSDQIVASVNTEVKRNDLVSLMQKLTANDIPVGSFVMNPATLMDTLKWGWGAAGTDIDPVTQREWLKTGVQYTLWEKPIVTSRILPRKIVYCYADKEYVGRMPVLKDLTVQLTDTPTKLEKGLFMFEFVGFYLASQKAIAKLVLDYSSTDETKKNLIHMPSSDEAYAREASIIGNIKGTGSREEGGIA